MQLGRGVRTVVACVALWAAGACGSVSPQSVELSKAVAADTQALHSSYRTLIREHFGSLRAQVNGFIDHEWGPEFLRNFIAETKLQEKVAQPDSTKVLAGLQRWVRVAVGRIEAKRKTLLDPIASSEMELTASVDEAFDRVARGQASITAYLQSQVDLKKEQDAALDRLGIKDLRDKIDGVLLSSSKNVDSAIESVKKADGIVTGVQDAFNGGN